MKQENSRTWFSPKQVHELPREKFTANYKPRDYCVHAYIYTHIYVYSQTSLKIWTIYIYMCIWWIYADIIYSNKSKLSLQFSLLKVIFTVSNNGLRTSQRSNDCLLTKQVLNKLASHTKQSKLTGEHKCPVV